MLRELIGSTKDLKRTLIELKVPKMRKILKETVMKRLKIMIDLLLLLFPKGLNRS